MGRPTERARGAAGPLFVDSSVWFAVASASDGHHAEAERWLEDAVATRVALLTTNLVVAEVHRLALHRMGVRPAAVMLDRLDASRLVRIVFPDAEHHAAARRWLAKLADQPITYTDAVSFAVAEATRCRAVLTFDRHFALAGFRLGPAARRS